MGIDAAFCDPVAGLAIAVAVGAQFIRVPVFVDTVITSDGVITPCAVELQRYRKLLGAEDIALLCEADGVHVGQDDLPVPEVRRLVGPDMIIGLSTHSPEQARAAEAAGADYIGVGPIYPTQTKKDVCAPVTLDYLDWVVANSPLPFVAIGGIKRHNIADVVAHGARCCALVSELVGAPDIAARVAEVRAAMRGRGQG